MRAADGCRRCVLPVSCIRPAKAIFRAKLHAIRVLFLPFQQRERSPDPGEAEEGGAAVPTPGAQRGKQREEPRLRHWRTLETFKDLSDNFLPKTISLATMSEFVQVAGDIHCATGLALFLVLKVIASPRAAPACSTS